MALLAVLVAAAVVGADAPSNTPPPGFIALFNGKDLTHWRESKGQGHWTVVDGVLHYDGKGDSLKTERDYGDVELYVDWKIGPKGDSGIYLRGNPQVQIWDDPIGSGGLFNNQKNPSTPTVKADRPPGEWNRFRILMVGDRVTIHLNDVLVVNDVVMENYWERDKPLYPRGQIELQHHGAPLYFKNIYLREIGKGKAK